MIEKGDIEGLKNAAAEDAKGLPLRIARQLGLHEDKTVEHTRFTQKTRSIEGYINPITQALNDLSDPSKEATALQKLQAMKQQANVQKEPVVDPTIAAIFANGYANSEQQPATADDGAVSSSGRTSSLDSLGPNSEY